MPRRSPASKQTTLANFFAGDVNNRDGVRVVAKDIDGDYRVDIVAGFGTGATKQVRVFAGKALPTTGSAAALGEFNIVPEFPVQAGDIFVG